MIDNNYYFLPLPTKRFAEDSGLRRDRPLMTNQIYYKPIKPFWQVKPELDQISIHDEIKEAREDSDFLI